MKRPVAGVVRNKADVDRFFLVENDGASPIRGQRALVRTKRPKHEAMQMYWVAIRAGVAKPEHIGLRVPRRASNSALFGYANSTAPYRPARRRPRAPRAARGPQRPQLPEEGATADLSRQTFSLEYFQYYQWHRRHSWAALRNKSTRHRTPRSASRCLARCPKTQPAGWRKGRARCSYSE